MAVIAASFRGSGTSKWGSPTPRLMGFLSRRESSQMRLKPLLSRSVVRLASGGRDMRPSEGGVLVDAASSPRSQVRGFSRKTQVAADAAGSRVYFGQRGWLYDNDMNSAFMADHERPAITSWGATRHVTGSMHLLETERQRVLLDCGLNLDKTQ